MLEKQLSRELVPAEQVRRQMALNPGQSTLEQARARLDASGQRRIQNGDFAPLRAPSATPASSSRDLTAVLRDKVVAQAREATALAQSSAESTKQAFLDRFLPAAQRAESITGIPASFILGQAALESGWGRREIRYPDGSSSHNLFGIKVGAAWQGDVVRARTTEYIDGQPRRIEQSFRAYDSYEASFEDYARLLAGNPRYAAVLQSGGSAERFAEGLQRAGYATDVRYADKLKATIRSVQRAM
jgi:flagellar protein FlgJ